MITASARELQNNIGYAKWDNFCCIINKAIQICPKEIRRTTIKVNIGSGAKRNIVDYILTEQAIEIVKKLSNKVTPSDYFKITDEVYIISLLDKYFKSKNIDTVYQYRLINYIYDCKIGNVLIEIDGHYHLSVKQKMVDENKNKVAIENGYSIVRITHENDIIDTILKIEKSLTVSLFSKDKIRDAGIKCELNIIDVDYLISNL